MPNRALPPPPPNHLGIPLATIDPNDSQELQVSQGAVMGTLERLLEESERARAEAEAARAEADEASRAKGDFLATMSHEFRTPLNAVLGYAQLLEIGVLGPLNLAQHDHLQRLQASAGHLLHLVNDVLDVAKADAEQLRVRRDVLVTGAARAAAIALVQPQATSKGVRIVDIHEDAPGVAYVGDEHRVRQILVNLLSNAVKFTAAGGTVTVDCGLQQTPVDDVTIVERSYIQISDTGAGVEQEMISRIFEPFVQGADTGPRGKGGTGLGLAISRRLARLMDGDITVSSEQGSGSTFTLWLPAPRDSLPAEAITPPTGTSVTNVIRTHTMHQPTPGLDDRGFGVLHAIGVRLAAHSESIAQRYVTALREDGRFPGADRLSSAQLRDHVTPLIGLIGDQLMTVGETRGQVPDLLRDGGRLQKMLAELHGAQRLRLGWEEVDIERETEIATVEVLRSIRNSVDTEGLLETNDISAESARAAMTVAAAYAVNVVRDVFVQARRTAIRSYRHTKATTEE